jgi:hypothetical protein
MSYNLRPGSCFVKATLQSAPDRGAQGILGRMCRVCLKRPEIPDERYGRCEACAKAGRVPVRFRVGPARGGAGLAVRAGEMSPRAMRSKLHEQLGKYSSQPGMKPHLGLHEVELILAKDRLEAVRVAPDLKDRTADVVDALRAAAERTDAAW